MSYPIDKMLDQVPWVEIEGDPPGDDSAYVTHEGVLDLGVFKCKVYQLNTGERLLDTDDVLAFFGSAKQ